MIEGSKSCIACTCDARVTSTAPRELERVGGEGGVLGELDRLDPSSTTLVGRSSQLLGDVVACALLLFFIVLGGVVDKCPDALPAPGPAFAGEGLG